MHGYHKSECGKQRADVGSTRWVDKKFLRTQTKLRWVCGLCNVWCKDENGFKCHLEHENHIRKSQMARQNAPEYEMSQKDEDFANRFVQHLASNHLNQKVLLHEIYRELYPSDKNQRVIKESCWGTLGCFINHLSRVGECEATREPKGWMVRVGQEMLLAAEEEKNLREKELIETQGKKEMDPASCLLAQEDVPDLIVPESRHKRLKTSWTAMRDKQACAPVVRNRDEGDEELRRARALARKAKKLQPEEKEEAPPEPTVRTEKVSFKMMGSIAKKPKAKAK
ncbi:unnamed protein product [Effrenium voratum]|uniref:DNA/RNA-binding protein Kin17 WH-like domain-containing protein n=1 Tax=Effrenium voratum TaxID=2562239 RepID=A0AA36HVG4_9DINO|nr:unnamed protein product [Effrenium voratum]CAJ1426935.1 unnamed protein product [Effrenium voratum]